MKIYQVIQTKFNQVVEENVRIITNLPTKRISVTSEEQTFLRVIPAETGWHRYGTKLCHCHPMCNR